jgi:hypothetical protein
LTIRSSSATEIERLITNLREGTAIERESAAARLRVLGTRAVDKLIALAKSDPEYGIRRSACAILEDIDDARARKALKTLAEAHGAESAPSAAHDPAAAYEWLQTSGAHAPLSELHQLVIALRDSERKESTVKRRQQWLAARGAAHAALAARDSRVALYDLRETLESAAGPLPMDFVNAARRIGDAECVEAMGAAWAAAPATETWWRSSLSRAARAIVAREGLTARHAAIKRVRAKLPEFLP